MQQRFGDIARPEPARGVKESDTLASAAVAHRRLGDTAASRSVLRSARTPERPMSIRTSRIGLWAGIAALLSLAACQRGPDPLAVLASARERADGPDSHKVVIELKALLQALPQNPEGRLLLGKALLASGDPVKAEAELRRARDAGQPDTSAAPLLATALLAQHKPAELIKEFANHTLQDPRAAADLSTQVALAHATLGQRERAEQIVGTVLSRQPDFAAAILLRARLAAARGDLPGAQAAVAELLEKQPTNAQAWLARADLLVARGGPELEAAEAAYRKALSLDPRLVPAHSGLLTLQVRRRDLPAAAAQAAAMNQALPDHPQSIYFDALVRQMRGDPTGAVERIQRLLTGPQDNVHVLTLAALSHLQLGAREQAEKLLEKAMTHAPDNAAVRRQLARVYLRSGKGERTLDVLKPLLGATSTDSESFVLVAQARLLAGDTKAAETAFARAAALRPGDPEVRTAVAKSFLARGQVEPGLRELQAAAAADTEGSDADLTLIGARLRRNELDAALKALDELARKQPREALPDHLRGHIATLKQDLPAARRAFESALSKDPRFFPSVTRLSELDLADQQVAAARGRYESLLKQQPDHVASMLALAALARRTGGSAAEATTWVDKAVKQRPKDVDTWRTAIDLHLQADDGVAALKLAQAGVAALPVEPDLLDRMVRAQLLAGQPEKALTSVEALKKMLPTSPYVHLLMADVYLAGKDDASANLAVQAALQLAPEEPGVQRSGAAIALRRGRPAEALALARAVQSRNPADAIGYRLEGDAEANLRHWDAAAAAFRKALDKRNPLDAAARHHFALINGGKATEAATFEKAWSKDHPADASFVSHLGQMALLRNDFAQAQVHYRRLLELRPDDVGGLNNLAYLLVYAGQPGGLPLAERAARLAPQRPDVLDTLAAAHAQAGSFDKAAEWQGRAVALAPEQGALRLNLARWLLRAGDKGKARTELETLARLGAKFAEQAEVGKLLKEAGG